MHTWSSDWTCVIIVIVDILSPSCYCPSFAEAFLLIGMELKNVFYSLICLHMSLNATCCQPHLSCDMFILPDSHTNVNHHIGKAVPLLEEGWEELSIIADITVFLLTISCSICACKQSATDARTPERLKILVMQGSGSI
jgi:hypothetical protein